MLIFKTKHSIKNKIIIHSILIILKKNKTSFHSILKIFKRKKKNLKYFKSVFYPNRIQHSFKSKNN